MLERLAALNYKVIAVTPHAGGGLSYDALFTGGKKHLVRGDSRATPEGAMENLYQKCMYEFRLRRTIKELAETDEDIMERIVNYTDDSLHNNN